MSVHDSNPQLILPVGTQVVARVPVKAPAGQPALPPGAMGIVVQAPADYWHAYRVEFPSGLQVSLTRDEIAIFSHFQSGSHPLDEHQLWNHVIYKCVVGSRAYGLETEASDTDRRGIYLPPADVHWSLYGIPEQLENDQTQETYWEMQKFLSLALKANPNVLECLYSPLVEHAAPIARELLAIRECFLSKLVYQTYNGYVMSQFRKLQSDLRNQGQIKWKHVMHLLRLLLSGIAVLRDGHVPVRIAEHRDTMLAIRRGELPWDELDKWRLALHSEFDQAFVQTRLPERPDYAKVNEFLLRARRSMV